MSFQAQVILVPGNAQTIGPWVNATFRYQQAFKTVSITYNPGPANLCRFPVITIVGGRDEWGRDIAAEVRQACPGATLDLIDVSSPHALRAVLDERVRIGKRLGDVRPEAPALPMGRFVAGLHGRADGEMQDADFKAVEVSKVEAVKLTTNASPQNVARLRQINPDMFIVIRLFEDFRSPAGPRRITAEEFANKFRPNPPGQGPTDFQRFYEQGIRYAEVHNEPNLNNEGFGGSWNSGAEFGAWYLEVIDRLRAWFPDAMWGFPGMSPGAVVPGRPQEMWDFLSQCEDAIAASDWLGVHHYFKDLDEMADGFEHIVGEYRRRWPKKMLMVTEFSNPIKDVPKPVKGQQYVEYYRRTAQIPGVAAAFAYVVSASDAAFQAETWREEDGSITSIAAAVGESLPIL